MNFILNLEKCYWSLSFIIRRVRKWMFITCVWVFDWFKRFENGQENARVALPRCVIIESHNIRTVYENGTCNSHIWKNQNNYTGAFSDTQNDSNFLKFKNYSFWFSWNCLTSPIYRMTNSTSLWFLLNSVKELEKKIRFV